MQKIFLFIYILVITLLLSSCEEKYNPNISSEEFNAMLVVDGLITTETGPFEIHLSTSVAIDQPNQIIPESDAQVTITNSKGIIYNLYEEEAGYYRTIENNLKAVVGESYTLSITTAKGITYESSDVEVTGCPEIDTVNCKEFKKTNFTTNQPSDETWLDIYVSTKGNANNSKYLKWDYEETWEIKIPDRGLIEVAGLDTTIIMDFKPNPKQRQCWITNLSSTILIATSEKQSINNISNYRLKSIGPKDDKLHYKYSILVKQLSINKELYNFWQKLENANLNQGDLFDKTPTSAYGNITCCNNEKKALGCFMASDIRKRRIFIDRSMHNLYTINKYSHCIYFYENTEGSTFFGYTIPDNRKVYGNAECSDCTTRGTNVKPPFWK